ncbi:MAG: adenylate/guanylate cyclase domain-containing protein [Planctomycetota bacterium]|nr:MAG: adenylate/guanylate cyclase domain-containing protein [Planctomycetota bacterium]
MLTTDAAIQTGYLTFAFIVIGAVLGFGIYFAVRFLELNSFAQRVSLAVTLVVSFTALALLFAAGDIFKSAELNIYDLQMRNRGPRKPHPDIVICAVDDITRKDLKSVDPVPRGMMAKVITNLAEAGASAISLDYTFSRDSQPGSKELATAIEESYCTILAMSIQGSRMHFSDNIFQSGAMGQGMINVRPDNDGTMRRIAFVVSEKKENRTRFPIFTLETLRVHLGISNSAHINGIEEDVDEAGKDILDVIYSVYEEKEIGQDDEGYPIIEYGKLLGQYIISRDGFLINYVGPAHSFRRLSFSNVLEGKFNSSLVDGKMVLLGDTRLAGGDVFNTPFNVESVTEYGKGMKSKKLEQMPGIEVHANILATIMDANEKKDSERYMPYQRRFSGNWYYFYLLVLGLVLGILFCFLKLPVYVNVGMFVVVGVSLFYTSVKLFSFKNNIFMPLVPTTFLLGANFMGGSVLHWLLDRMRTRSVIGQWGRYMSKNIVEKIVSGQLTVNTAGHEKELTLLFSDIRGFTTASEGLGPEGIARLLNAFFNRMITCVFDSEGTMDKLMGDCIMAFWNDPVSQPDHRKRACETALNMMEELRNFNAENPVPGADKVNIGIGLNSGPATVGDLGADFYSDYTALGDTVNTASRLEGINKYYRTNIIISNDTFEPVKKHFEARHIDTIRVKGREKPVEIFELLCRREKLSEDMKKQLESFDAAWEIYKTRDWEAAHHIFAEHLKDYPDDGPAQTLLERADSYRRTPPPKNWDGVYDFETK